MSSINSLTREQSFAQSLLNALPRFPLEAIRHLEQVSELRNYHTGNVIIREGQSCDGILALLEGTVQPSLSVFSLAGRKWAQLSSICGPAVLGTAACMLGEPSTLSISACSPIAAVFIPKAHLLRVLRECPEAGLGISQLLTEELAQTYAQLTELRAGSVSKRPLHLLN